MHNAEYDQFTGVLKGLGQVFSKPIDDEIVKAYWGALRDQTLASVDRLANSHIRFGKFFPKPFELRPREDTKKIDPKEDGAYQWALAYNKRIWDESLAIDPERYGLELHSAKCARIMVLHAPGTTEHDTACREDRRTRDQLLALFAARANKQVPRGTHD